MKRDMTEAQFRRACERYGFMPGSIMGGYYLLPDTGGRHVYAGNAGPRRRAQLAYLIREHAKALEKHPPEEEATV